MEALQHKLAAGEAALRGALLAGTPTMAIRQSLTSVREEIARAEQNAEAANADVEADRQADLAARTRLIVNAANARIIETLAGLAAPDSI